jgi:hypothetical protein
MLKYCQFSYFFEVADLRYLCQILSVFYNSTVPINVQEIRSRILRWSWLHFLPLSQLPATALFVKQTALTLHIVSNYIVWWRTEIKGAQTATGTLCWWAKSPFTVVTSREREVRVLGWQSEAAEAYREHSSPPALRTCSSGIWCSTKCIFYRWTARRIADNFAAAQRTCCMADKKKVLCISGIRIYWTELNLIFW